MLPQSAINITNRVHELVEKANQKYNANIPKLNVTFDIRGKKVAGMAYYRSNKVSFNMFYINNMPAEEFDSTVIHEVAHIVTRTVFPNARQSHGPEFKSVDLALGGRGTRCHNYNSIITQTIGTSERKTKTHTRMKVDCVCSSYVLGPNQSSKLRRNPGYYRCSKCKTNLKPTGVWVV